MMLDLRTMPLLRVRGVRKMHAGRRLRVDFQLTTRYQLRGKVAWSVPTYNMSGLAYDPMTSKSI